MNWYGDCGKKETDRQVKETENTLDQRKVTKEIGQKDKQQGSQVQNLLKKPPFKSTEAIALYNT